MGYGPYSYLKYAASSDEIFSNYINITNDLRSASMLDPQLTLVILDNALLHLQMSIVE